MEDNAGDNSHLEGDSPHIEAWPPIPERAQWLFLCWATSWVLHLYAVWSLGLT